MTEPNKGKKNSLFGQKEVRVASCCSTIQKSAKKIEDASGLRLNLVTKSFKSTRKKENLSQISRGHFSQHKVPLTLERKTDDKLESTSLNRVGRAVVVIDDIVAAPGSNPLGSNPPGSSPPEPGPVNCPRESVFVRETKASRLRASKRILTLKPSNENRKRLTENLFVGRTHYNSSTTSATEKIINDKRHSHKLYFKKFQENESICDRVMGNVKDDEKYKSSYIRSSSLNDSVIRCENVLPTSSTVQKTLKSSQRPSLNVMLHEKCSNRDKMSNTKTLNKTEREKCKMEFREKSILSHLNARENNDELLHKIKNVKIRDKRYENKNLCAEKMKGKMADHRKVSLNTFTLKGFNDLNKTNENKKENSIDWKIGKCTRRLSMREDQQTKLVVTPNKKSSILPIKIMASNGENAEGKVAKYEKVLSPTSATQSNVVRSGFSTKANASKPSILKTKPQAFCRESTDCTQKSKPISILKRKCFQNDESSVSSPPVTFSPSAFKKENDSKRQGILKKRRSLDENEIMRKRSNSLDAKPILKNQRRCSMEEFTRRMQSPDSVCPQGILKRKPSKEEEMEDVWTPSGMSSEPQSILKRKQSVYTSVPSECAIVAAPQGIQETLSSVENVRPILKKKNLSEEHGVLDSSMIEAPKSILKKKSSWESEELEEKPKKPILKTSKTLSVEEPEEFSKIIGSESVKPILRREHVGRSTNSQNVDSDDLLPGRIVSGRHSFSGSDGRESKQSLGIIIKRLSLDLESLEFENLNFDQPLETSNQNLKKPFSSQTIAPLSSSDETVLKSESLSQKNQFRVKNFKNIESSDICCDLLTTENDNSYTQGTEKTIQYEFPLFSSSILNEKCKSRTENLYQKEKLFPSDFCSPEECSKSENSFKSLEIISNVESVNSFSFSGNSSAIDPEVTIEKEKLKQQQTHNEKESFSIDVCESKISILNLKQSTENNILTMEKNRISDLKEERDEKETILPMVSSVSSFSDIFISKNEGTQENDESKSDNNTISGRRRLNKKLFDFAGQRLRNRGQSISFEQMEFAVQKSKNDDDNFASSLIDQDVKHEDEASNMSYLDRVRLFEMKFCSKGSSNSFMGSRNTRFCTQPVTLEEIEEAKSRNCRPLNAETSQKLKTDCSDKNKTLKTEDLKQKCKFKTSSINPPPSFIKAQNNVISELNNILKNSSSVQKKFSSDGLNQSAIEEKKLMNNKENVFESVESQKVSTENENETKTKNWFLPKESQLHQKNESNSRNNSSSVVKSQSHSGVLSVFETSKKSSNNTINYSNSSNEKKELDLNKICESSDSCDDVQTNLEGCLRRSLTQPFNPSLNVVDDDLNGATIRQRLDRLKKNGELGWQSRKHHSATAKDELLIVSSEDHAFKFQNAMEQLKNQKISKTEESKFTSLADRLNKLGAAQSGWKKRIQQSDATRFSVEGKMISQNSPNLSLPPTKITRQRRSPKAIKFRSKEGGVSSNSEPSATETDFAPSTSKDDLKVLSGLSSGDSKMFQESVAIIPQNDDETFTSFFNGFSEKPANRERVEINDEDLDAVARMKSSQLLVLKKNIKTQKRKKIIQNPLKSLALRLESQTYTERRTQKCQTEFKKFRSENASFSNENVSNMAIEALAGLASQEDFTLINLKKTSDDVVSPDAPYKDPMLIQVKGRRHVQTRLVEPVAASINAGDCFILVTGNKVFNYVGKFANVIEKSRSSEISCHIQQKGDLGCSTDFVITVGESGKATQEETEEFWKILGGSPGCEREAGNPDEDEIFESCLVDTNMVYELINDELVPVETFWGSSPKFEILDPFKVFVFDFGSEFYVWNGKNVSLAKRRIAIKLGKELWEEGFNYLDCALCPITAASFAGIRSSSEEISDLAKTGSSRPSWALFAKITQNMETVLFKEKFLDWPNHSRVIGKHKREKRVGDKKNAENGESEDHGHVLTDLILPDPVTMVENVVPLPDLVLEGSHLGRGLRYCNDETGISTEITTKDVTMWHINEFEYSKVPCDSEGHFHMGDSYVVRWHYVVTVVGRSLKGLPSKHLTTGRDRYAYFCWQGQDSLINDKGAAACLTIELDKENGPQVRVTQGFEPPAFLNLFRGKMVVHQGKRFSEVPCDKWRLFLSRGESETESVLFEVPCSAEHLRSAGSFVLVNAAEGKIIVWHGSKSGETQKKIAVAAAERIKNQRPKEFKFLFPNVFISKEIEGDESKEFLKIFGDFDRKLYYSLLDKKEFQMTTPRLFYLSSFSGQLQFSEVSSPYLGEKTTTPFPFLQSDLYSAFQPALFLLDAGSVLWLWQGWQEEGSKSDRGSENLRFQAERRAAMTTALSYWTHKNGNASTPNVYLIWAGLEPLIFTNQFPFWTIRDDVSRLNIKDGRKPGEMIHAKDELDNLSHSFYPPLQLQTRPLPEGVNPFSLEDYLKPQYFQELFGLEKEEFFKMPSWKKKKLKKEAGLF